MIETEERQLIAVQLRGEQIRRLAELVGSTGWNKSEVIRQLIDNATVRAAQVRTEIEPK